MSSFFAIGAVTAVLRGMLEASAAAHDLATVLGAPPEVSTLPPDRVQTGQNTPDRINLFLFQATESAAWRNQGFPALDATGARVANPKLALDLHYLVTAYGSADYRAEILLGHAMFVFHQTPVLARQAIRDALAALAPSNLADTLGATRLADQAEQIKIAPRLLNVEEISKIWTALQSQYRTTVAYHVSVVLIESEQPARAALPVLTRGQPLPALGRDEGVRVQVGAVAPYPTVESLAAPGDAPAVRLGEAFTVRGHDLAGTQPRARFHPPRPGPFLELPAAPGAGAASFTVTLPPDPPPGPVAPGSPQDPARWQIGIYEVAAVVEQAGSLRESNRQPLVLAPRLDAVTVHSAGGNITSLEVTCSPPVRAGQSAVLLVGATALAAPAINAPTRTLTFPVPQPGGGPLPSGAQWVRLRVDGIESLVVDYQARPPVFQGSQSVVLP